MCLAPLIFERLLIMGRRLLPVGTRKSIVWTRGYVAGGDVSRERSRGRGRLLEL